MPDSSFNPSSDVSASGSGVSGSPPRHLNVKTKNSSCASSPPSPNSISAPLPPNAKPTFHIYIFVSIILICFFLSFIQTFAVVHTRQALVQSSTSSSSSVSSYPAHSDLLITLVGLLVILLLRQVLVHLVYNPLGDWLLPTLEEKKGKWTLESRLDRVERFATCAFKLTYFICSTLGGWYVLTSEEQRHWFPSILGGEQGVGTSELWRDYPFAPLTTSVKYYYMLSLSYHAHSLILHVFSSPTRNDYIEMTLHHICAVLLVYLSYYHNFIRVGCMILLLHDTADVFAYLVKCSVDTKYTAVTLAVYLGLLITWGYTRLVIFPLTVIYSTLFELDLSQPHLHFFSYCVMVGMILVLQILHIYWYALFLVMGYRFVVTKETVDLQQRAGHAYEQKLKNNGKEEGNTSTNGHENGATANGVKKLRKRGGN